MTLEQTLADAESELSDAIYEMQSHGLISETQAESMNNDLQHIIVQAEDALGTSLR